MLHPVRPVPEVRHSRDVAPPSSTERLLFLSHRFISRLAPEFVDDVTSYVATRGLPAVAAVCSGTDSPILCMDVVATEMRRRGVATQPHHQFSCERDRHKRNFIQAVFPGATIFQDACELPQGRALLHDGSRAQVPPFNMLIAGFPCTSASLLNPRATTEANRTCVANAALATGSVFEALVQLLECQKGNASVAIFEHVTTLAQPHASQRASNLDAVVATLRSRCQMSLHVWQMDPHRDVGGPQLRQRLWMVAVKLELLHKLGFSEESASDKLCSLMNKLVGSHPTPLSEVLYAESCPFLVNANRNALAKRLCAEGDLRTATMVLDGCLPTFPKRRRKLASGAVRWPPRHCDLFRARGLQWDAPHVLDCEPDMQQLCPGLADLTQREREVLTLAGVTNYPMTEEVSVEITQSAGRQRLHHEHCSTILPKGRQYLGRRCRLMHPYEALRCHGIYLPEATLSGFAPALIESLAGNAFDTGCCLAVLVATLALISTGAGPRLSGAGPVAEPCEDNGPSDDDANDDESLWELVAKRPW